MDMLRAIPESHPLHRLFRGLTEYAFMNELGIGDPSLVEYVAELLARFVPSQALWRLRDAQGRRLTEVTAMVAEAEAAADAERQARVPPPRRRFHPLLDGRLSRGARPSCEGRDSPDALINYQEQGKRSYYVASRLSSGSFMAPVFRRLSDEFELCAFGLSCVRREWEKLDRRAIPAEGDLNQAGASDRASVRHGDRGPAAGIRRTLRPGARGPYGGLGLCDGPARRRRIRDGMPALPAATRASEGEVKQACQRRSSTGTGSTICVGSRRRWARPSGSRRRGP